MSNSLQPHRLQHTRLPCPSPAPRISDAIQPSHPLSSSSPPAFNLSQHQGLSSNIPGSYAILLIVALDLTSITSHIHNWVLFLLWLCLFILSVVISPLIFSSILGTYRSREFIFQRPIFSPFHTVHGVLKARNHWSGLQFPSPVDHILSDLSTMTHLSWVALHGLAYSFVRQGCDPYD